MFDKNDRVSKMAELIVAMSAVIIDERNGYLDRSAGYYDKWCCSNRSDGGIAYNRGVRKALKDAACTGVCTIIEWNGE